jgi:hypothetical protein
MGRPSGTLPWSLFLAVGRFFSNWLREKKPQKSPHRMAILFIEFIDGHSGVFSKTLAGF